jgi:hypothetical protein
MLRLSALVALLGVCTACGGASPTAPAPVVPTPIPAATLRVLTEDEPRLTASADGWRYAGSAQNTGDGCAANVVGTVTFKDLAGVTLQTSEFRMAATIGARAVFDFEGCCMSADTYDKMDGGTLLLGFRWDNVRC